MNKQTIDDQFFLDLRRDIDALGHELKSLTNFVYEIEKTQRVLGEDTTARIQYFYNAIAVLDDIIAPIEEKIFPEVSQARVRLAQIVDDQANRKTSDTDT